MPTGLHAAIIFYLFAVSVPVTIVGNGSGGQYDCFVVPELKDIHCVKLNQVTVPASNIAASVEFYVRIGLELIVSSPHYARFICPDGDSSFSVHLVPELIPWSGTVVYFEVLALDKKVRELQDRGILFMQEPRDEPWLWREARLLDPSGNVICLYTAGVNRLNPPWRLQSNKMG